jgi:hypothetical protein
MFLVVAWEIGRGSISGRWYKRLRNLRVVILFIQVSRNFAVIHVRKFRPSTDGTLVFKMDFTCTCFRIRPYETPLITQNNKTISVLGFYFQFF